MRGKELFTSSIRPPAGGRGRYAYFITHTLGQHVKRVIFRENRDHESRKGKRG
jgi:hypothetical protein